MTPLIREELIRRHLAGSMSAVEQQEFQISLALDGELVRMLTSHTVIDQAMAADRDRRAMLDESGMRAQVLAMSTSHGLEPAPVVTAPSGSRAPSVMIRRFAAASAMLLGTVGIYFMLENAPVSQAPMQNVPVTPPQVEMQAPAAPLAAPETEAVAPVRSEVRPETTSERVKAAPSRRAAAPVENVEVVTQPEMKVEAAPVDAVESAPAEEVVRVDTVDANVVGRGVVSPMKNKALERKP